MRALTVINVVLLILVAAGFCLMAVKTANIESKLVKIEEDNKRIGRLSEDISTAFTRIGQLETQARGLTEQVEAISSKGADVGDVEYLVRKVVREEGQKWTQQFQQRRAQGMKAVADLNLKPEQVDAGGEIVKKGMKDWFELQNRVQAGEITQEEARRLMGEGWKEFQEKFKAILNEEQVKKLEKFFQNRAPKKDE